MLSILLAATLAQAPIGVGQVPTTTLESSFPPSSYVQHIFIDSTRKCLLYSDGLAWKCLVEEGDPVSGVESLSSAPSSPVAGRTYFDTTKGCPQTWTGSAWYPTTCPLLSVPAQPSPPNTLLSPASTPPTTSIVGATYYDTSAGCLRTWNGTTYNTCPAPTPSAPQVFLSPASSPPSTSVLGASYFDTGLGCIRTWNGSAFVPAACPPTSQPVVPNILLGPAGSPPATSVVGATFYDTSGGCLRTWTGSAYTACSTSPTVPQVLLAPAATAPSTSTVGATYFDTTDGCLKSWTGTAFTGCASSPSGTSMFAASSAPSLPAGQASANRGKVYFDTALGCTRSTRDGLTWGDCLTTQKCTDITVSGLSIPLVGLTTTTSVTFTGALAGRDCTLTPPSFLPLGAKAVCRVVTANNIDYRWEAGGLLSSVLAIPNGTHKLCTEVLW